MSGFLKLSKRTAKEIFDSWALDYHADGMEKSHWQSVRQAFDKIPESCGNYLEIGFGNGYGIAHMATHQYQQGTCYGLDISPNMVEKAQKRLDVFNNIYLNSGDFLTWQPDQDLKFSCIFSMEVFYYFQNIREGIQKAVSLLEPKGMLMILVNHYLENVETHSWSDDLQTRMTLWSKEDYRTGLLEAGLSHVKQEILNAGDGLGTLCTWAINQ